MPSDQRLHPLSILFGFVGQVPKLLLPGLFVLFTARSSQWGNWELWAMLLVIPYTLVAVWRYVTFRYWYEPHEMVIRTGLLFRNERHIPYARIQNLDAIQNVLHRLLNVVEVRVQTGGGQEPEATMSVLPAAAFEEMRRRVFEQKQVREAPAAGDGAESAETAVPAAVASAGPSRTLLHLPLRELVLGGLIENRGAIIVGAAFGLLWEVGMMDRFFGGVIPGQGMTKAIVKEILNTGGLPFGRIAFTFTAIAVFLILMRLLSMVWTPLRLYGFTLTRSGEDLRTEYGLLTRVTATIPLRRIQNLTIREGLLHRLFRRAAVKVETAGGSGEGDESASRHRESIAPIIRREALPDFLREVAPEIDLSAVAWQKVHPRAFRREIKVPLILFLALALPLVLKFGGWTYALPPVIVVWILVAARIYVAHLGWAVTDGAVLFRSGWLWRRMSVARFAKIQAVAIHESPLDRRAAMARVRVDTAGAGSAGHRVDIPYLARDTARALYDLLSRQAAQTAFRW
jgi:putative membrane protein